MPTVTAVSWGQPAGHATCHSHRHDRRLDRNAGSAEQLEAIPTDGQRPPAWHSQRKLAGHLEAS